jgi:hypothetical protein
MRGIAPTSRVAACFATRTEKVGHAASRVDTLDHAKRYMQSPELQQMLKKSGVVGKPEVRYLAEMYTIRRSAAD